MSRLSLSELKFEQSMEDLFWKQKTWNGLENETSPDVLKEAIQLLLELIVQKQSIIKSLVQYQMKQDLQDLAESMEEYKSLSVDILSAVNDGDSQPRN